LFYAAILERSEGSLYFLLPLPLPLLLPLSLIPTLSEAEGDEPASPTTNPVISTEARSA
jgi:hypothetical protein